MNNYKNLEIKKHSLTIEEYFMFIKRVVDDVVDEETRTVDYMKLQVSKKIHFAYFYLLGDEDKKDKLDIDNIYKLAHNIDYEYFKNSISYNQLNDIFTDIDNCLRSYEQNNNAISQFFDTLEDMLKPLFKDNGNLYNSIDKQLKEVNDMLSKKVKKDDA